MWLGSARQMSPECRASASTNVHLSFRDNTVMYIMHGRNSPHLGIPDHLGRLKLAQEHLAELLRPVVHQEKDECLRQNVPQRALGVIFEKLKIRFKQLTVTYKTDKREYSVGWDAIFYGEKNLKAQ